MTYLDPLIEGLATTEGLNRGRKTATYNMDRVRGFRVSPKCVTCDRKPSHSQRPVMRR